MTRDAEIAELEEWLAFVEPIVESLVQDYEWWVDHLMPDKERLVSLYEERCAIAEQHRERRQLARSKPWCV